MTSDDKKREASYSTDAPISSRAADRFERWPFGERVASTIAARPDSGSLVVGYDPRQPEPAGRVQLAKLRFGSLAAKRSRPGRHDQGDGERGHRGERRHRLVEDRRLVRVLLHVGEGAPMPKT